MGMASIRENISSNGKEFRVSIIRIHRRKKYAAGYTRAIHAPAGDDPDHLKANAQA
jgi:hypothetical protein